MAECEIKNTPKYQLTLDEMEAQILMELIGTINDNDSDRSDPYYQATQRIFRALDACSVNMPDPFRVMVVMEDDDLTPSLLIKQESDE